MSATPRRCDNWPLGIRCSGPGEVLLYSPSGGRVPGGPICRKCAEACVTEYQELLGEEWSIEPAGWELA